MKIYHVRNATLLVSLGDQRLLVDPMLSATATLPGFKMVGGGRRRNPLVPLPANAVKTIESATGVLITHEHPDHLDGAAITWIKTRQLPVWCSEIDAPNLSKKGLDAREIRDGDMELSAEVIPARHGHGLIGWLMGPVSGFFLACPREPSLYITGDTVMTDQVRTSIERLQPDVIVAPAGAANFGIGRDILFSIDELVALARLAPRNVVFNHLEAIDHCPTTREGLRELMDAAGVGQRVFIPVDGEQLEFPSSATNHPAVSQSRIRRRPGFQKWLTAKFAGT